MIGMDMSVERRVARLVRIFGGVVLQVVPCRRPITDLTSMIGVAGMLEVVLGALIIVGFLGSYAAFIASGEMAAAYFMAQFPFAILPISPAPGIVAESAVFNCFFFLYVASKGSGILSVDNFLQRRRAIAAPVVSV